MKSKPFYGFGDYIGKQVRAKWIFSYGLLKCFTMNARLCERIDTWHRPEPFEVPFAFSPHTLSSQTTHMGESKMMMMMKNDFFIIISVRLGSFSPLNQSKVLQPAALLYVCLFLLGLSRVLTSWAQKAISICLLFAFLYDSRWDDDIHLWCRYRI